MKSFVNSLIALAAVCLSLTTVRAENPPTFVQSWGTYGTGDGQFGWPICVIADPNNIYVVDGGVGYAGPKRVEKFSSNGDFLLSFGSYGFNPGQFNNPLWGDYSEADGLIYIADEKQLRVLSFTTDGTFVREFGGWNLPGCGGIVHPNSATAGPDGRIYTAEGGGCILRSTSTGDSLEQWPAYNAANDIVFDRAHNVLYVTDAATKSIVKVSPDGSTLLSWNVAVQIISGLAVDKQGNVYVTADNEIRKYDPQGTLLTRWGTWGSDPGQFKYPKDVAVDADGNIYVVDQSNYRIQKFAPATPVQPTTWGAIKAMYK